MRSLQLCFTKLQGNIVKMVKILYLLLFEAIKLQNKNKLQQQWQKVVLSEEDSYGGSGATALCDEAEKLQDKLSCRRPRLTI